MATERHVAQVRAAPARRWPLDALLLALTCGLALGLTRAYVSVERTFYYWDFGVHWELAVGAEAAFRRSLEDGLEFVQASLAGPYNALFALPLVPLLAWWGTSRGAYEGALALVCFVPLPLAVGALATRIAPENRRAAFWSAAGLTLLTPMAWVPMLRGFPDSAAAGLMCVALRAWLADPRLGRARTPVAMGGVAALATLLRRHFAYATLALGALAALTVLRELGTAPEGSHRRALGRAAGRLALFAAAGLTTAGLLGPGFVRRVLEHDHRALHRSYEMPIGALGRFFVEGYGLLFVIAAVAGLVCGLRSARLERSALVGVAGFGALQALLWAGVVRQVGEQYSLHFTPALVVCAWALIWSPARARARAGLAVGLVLLGLANMWFGLALQDPWESSPGRELLASNSGPRRHPGYDGVLDLVRALRASPLAGRPVFVAASSFCLNPDMLRRADGLVRGEQPPLDVRNAPEIDSNASYPMGRLLDAGLAVVGEPLQLHLPETSQRLLAGTVALFTRRAGLAAEFEPWPQPLDLVRCRARVYERRRETSLASALATLAELERSLGTRPGLQPDWVVIQRAFPSWLTRRLDGRTSWTAHPAGAGQPGASRLSTLAPTGRGLVSGVVRFIDERCPGVTLELARLDTGAVLRPVDAARRRPGDGAHFALGARTETAQRLVLSLLPYSAESGIDHCLLTIDELELRPDESEPDARAALQP